jgi:hypothetical protein
MLAVAAFTDLLIGIGFAREDYEPCLVTKVVSARSFVQGMAVLGVVEGAAIIFTYLTAMRYYGFTWNSITYTDLHQCFNGSNVLAYDSSVPNLNNPNLPLNITTGCNLNMDYYDSQMIVYTWMNSTYLNWDHRQIFVHCAPCPIADSGFQNCWISNHEYATPQTNDQSNFTQSASYYASTSVFIALVLCQW